MKEIKRIGYMAALVVTLVVAGSVMGWAQDAPAIPDTSLQDSEAGAADRLEGAIKNLKYLHGAGGPTMYFIDLAMIIGVAFVLERTVRMRRSRILPGRLLDTGGSMLEEGNYEGLAAEAAKYGKSTLGKVFAYLAAEGKDIERTERDATVNELASRDIDVHRMMCFPLAAIAGLAPLMGLLGTVAGIRECFRDVALAGEMGNPAMLAGGIEKALITTIYGLVVAIITLFGYNLFKFRINLVSNELEEVISSIMSRHFRSEASGKL